MAVNRRITGTAHQGGSFTAGKIPTTTLNIFDQTCIGLKSAGWCSTMGPPDR